MQCYSSKVKVCNNPHYHISPLQTDECQKVGTKAPPYNMHAAGHDLHSSGATSLSRPSHHHNIGIYPKMKASGKVYNVTTARVDCLERLNTRVFQLCQKVPNFDVEPYIDSCTKDAILTNSMDWSLTHLESLKAMCKHQIEITQPLPHEMLSHTTFTNHEHKTDVSAAVNHSDTVVHALPLQNIPAHEFLDLVEKSSCLNECSGHGNCVNGTCDCDEGFANTDCSVNITTPPEIIGIPGQGLCDVSKGQQKQCMKTSVLGDNFVDSKNLTCNVTSFYVTDNGTHIFLETKILQATRMSFAEVTCPLHHETKRRKREALGTHEKRIFVARGYSVSISNDAITFGDSDAVAVFDSTCVNCTKIDLDIICVKDHTYCMMNGRCYSVGKPAGCEECSMNGGSRAEWVTKSDCLTRAPEYIEPGPRKSSTVSKESTTKPNTPTAKSSGIGNTALIAIFSSVFLVATFVIVLAMCMVYRTKYKPASSRNTDTIRNFKGLPRPKYVCAHEKPPPYYEEYELPAPDYDNNDEPDPDYEDEEHVM